MTGKLYIVATPIGNLEDITLRALRVLKEVDLILCEDTRVTKKLLDRYEIQKPLLSYHHHSKISRIEKIVEHLKNGKNLALVSDAGTPGISDPGNELIDNIIKTFFPQMRGDVPKGQRGVENNSDNHNTSPNPSSTEEGRISIVPIPGTSAVTTLASVAGINMSRFTFFGFPPHKKGRETFFREVAEAKFPVIYFESPHRFLKNLELLEKMKPDAKLIVGREMTKMFEEIRRGEVQEIIEYYGGSASADPRYAESYGEARASASQGKIKGEFVIIAY